jgi:hypothetical protein
MHRYKKEIASKYGEKKLGSVEDDDNVCQSTLGIRSSNGVSIPVFLQEVSDILRGFAVDRFRSYSSWKLVLHFPRTYALVSVKRLILLQY